MKNTLNRIKLHDLAVAFILFGMTMSAFIK